LQQQKLKEINMKNTFTLNWCYILLIPIILVLNQSCIDEIIKKQDPKQAEETGDPTNIGIPNGTPESTLIGPSGGTYTTKDGRLRIEIPQGVLSSSQNITIQPITNTAPGGIGTSYSITPDLEFNKPAKLTFSYSEENISNTLPELLMIAYQDQNNVWQAMPGAVVHMVNKTVTIETTHFSNWTLFPMLEIYPETATVAPGESVELKVYKNLELGDELTVPALPGESPLINKREVSETLIEKWEIGGEGQLARQGTKAIYTAPGQTPKKNPVAVSAKIRSRTKELYLVSNIFVGKEGITFRVNNGEWRHCKVNIAGSVEGYSQITGEVVTNGVPEGNISIIWSGKANESITNWTSTTPAFKAMIGNYLFWQFMLQGTTPVPSPGTLEIEGYGEVGGYINGRFYLEKAGKQLINGSTNPFVETAKIEGYFRVKRTQ
jgi:hypothetical protein